MALLQRLALHRPELRAWALYDWANSAFVTLVVASVFPVFYDGYANAGADKGEAALRFNIATAIAVLTIAILAPILGTVADARPLKKRFLAIFATIGACATAAMATVGEGGWLWASALFIAANIGASGSFVFYDSLLPHIASDDEMDRVSTAGYALGYVAGAVLLAVILSATQNPSMLGATTATGVAKISFVVVAGWWLVFSLPLFLRVREPACAPDVVAPRGFGIVSHAVSTVAATFRELRRYPEALKFLIAFLIYNDGVGTIIRMAVIYGAEIELPTKTLFGAIVLVQIVGIPFTFLFGAVAGKLGTKTSIYIAIGVYGLVSVLGFFMTSSAHFYALAVLIGMVQGGVQALSRSLFASLIPRAKSSEFFGLFAVFERFAGVLGPMLFAMVIAVTGGARAAILALISFFVIGAVLLRRVDVEKGRQAAQS